jgi:hypothetical protein
LFAVNLCGKRERAGDQHVRVGADRGQFFIASRHIKSGKVVHHEAWSTPRVEGGCGKGGAVFGFGHAAGIGKLQPGLLDWELMDGVRGHGDAMSAPTELLPDREKRKQVAE